MSSKLQIEHLVVGPLSTNCYIVYDKETKKGAVIDPGEDSDTILSKIKLLNIEIDYILATHSHFDHVVAVVELKRKTNAKFLAHKADMFYIEEGKKIAQNWGFEIEQIPVPDRFIEDGDEIPVGKFKLKVIYTPGHSPGGVSFLGDGIVFSGDTLFQGSIGRTDFHLGSIDQLMDSINTRLFKLPDDTIVYPGHGPSTTIGEEKRTNPFVL